MSRVNLSILAVAFLGLVLALFGQSAQLLKQFEAQGLAVQYVQGSPLSGRAFIGIKNQWQPLWLDLTWRWCPGLNPASWCINAQGDIGEARGNASLGANAINLNNLQLSGENITVILAGFIEASGNIDANIDSLILHKGEQLNAIKSVQATLLLSELYAMGVDFAPHRITASRKATQAFQLVIEGDQANGKTSVSGAGQYKTDLRLTPGENLAHLLKQQLPEAPEGTFRFEHNGSLAALR